jgi:prevent-host-death family protein
MKQVNVHEAKSHLSRLLDEAEAGEEIIIARNGKPAVRLVPVVDDGPVIIGMLKGKLSVPDDFNDPLPDDLLDLFEGKTV